MDCIKNLTACAGCTKKHAKCSWRDVREIELYGPEKGKVPIPPPQLGQGMDIDPRDREPSVGLRPNDHASVQLLQALGGADHHQEHHHHNGGFPRDPRALALEGLSAAEQHANGHEPHGPPIHGDYHSPQSHAPPQQGYPSRPPSSGPHPPYGAQESAQHYQPYETPLPSREVGPER